MCSLWGIRRGWRNSWASSVVYNYDGVICEVKNQVKGTLGHRASNMIFSNSQVSELSIEILPAFDISMMINVISVGNVLRNHRGCQNTRCFPANYSRIQQLGKITEICGPFLTCYFSLVHGYTKKFTLFYRMNVSPAVIFTVRRRWKLQICEVLGNIIVRM